MMAGGEYECDQCPKRYNTEDLLQRHIRKVHVGPRWQCPDCIYSADYSDRPGLRRHLQLDHHYSKEAAMEVQFRQVKPRRKRNNNKRLRSPSSENRARTESNKSRSFSSSPPHSQQPPPSRPKSSSSTSSLSVSSPRSEVNNNNHHPEPKLETPRPPLPPPPPSYPSQVSSQVNGGKSNAGGGGLKAVWTGIVPKGASITHLGVPQPIIERHFIQADDDNILVKEVFLFQAPAHWTHFEESRFEITTPSGKSASTLLNGRAESAGSSKDEEEEEEDNGTDNRDILITVNGENEEL